MWQIPVLPDGSIPVGLVNVSEFVIKFHFCFIPFKVLIYDKQT